MGVPTTTARSAPVGIKLGNGYSTKIALSQDADISFWEKTVQPPGATVGDRIDNTTMHNVTWRTFKLQSLLDLTPLTLSVAYDPVVYDQIIAILGTEGAITVHFPNADTLDFFGGLTEFIPQSHEDGAMPMANAVIQPTNVDPSDGSEAGPNYITAAGTD